MAVNYAAKIYANDKLFFLKLICRWTGSVWKLIWVDFIVYILIYVGISSIYRLYVFDDPDKKVQFETIAKWISLIRSGVPLSFMLGFFVSYVLGRWWDITYAIPWLNSPAFFVQTFIRGGERYGDLAKKLRLTILRYLNMSWILVFGNISMQVKNRFNFKKRSTPFGGEVNKDYVLTWKERLDLINNDSKVKKYFGTLITKPEFEAFSRAAELGNDDEYSYSPDYWMPLVWATRLIHKAHEINCIRDERQLMRLMELVANFRGSLGSLWMLTEFTIPLVYTQVATLAVYIYLLSGLFSSQISENAVVGVGDNSTLLISSDTKSPIFFIPLLGMFEFVFYLGWFKIGMCLINPLGEDEEDLPLSDILNSNLKISVKCGSAENSIFPDGLSEYGSPEDQIIEVLSAFNFSLVRAHDKFESPEETEARIKAEQLRKQKRLILPHSRMFSQQTSTNTNLSTDTAEIFNLKKKIKKLIDIEGFRSSNENVSHSKTASNAVSRVNSNENLEQLVSDIVASTVEQAKEHHHHNKLGKLFCKEKEKHPQTIGKTTTKGKNVPHHRLRRSSSLNNINQFHHNLAFLPTSQESLNVASGGSREAGLATSSEHIDSDFEVPEIVVVSSDDEQFTRNSTLYNQV